MHREKIDQRARRVEEIESSRYDAVDRGMCVRYKHRICGREEGIIERGRNQSERGRDQIKQCIDQIAKSDGHGISNDISS
jgi:hypothetical protein